MNRARIRPWDGLRVAALGLLLCGAAVPGPFQLPQGPPLELFVTVTVRPTASQKGGRLTIPVEIEEVRVTKRSVVGKEGKRFFRADDEAKYAGLVPKDFFWGYADGVARLSKTDDPRPTRTFALVIPGMQTYRVQKHLAIMAGDCFEPESTALGEQPSLKAALEVLALAVVGVKPKGLSSLFPIPFAEDPPVLGSSTELLALEVVPRPAVTLNSPYKIDGAAAALVRGLVDKKIVSAPDSTVWDGGNIHMNLAAIPATKLVMARTPEAAESSEGTPVAASDADQDHDACWVQSLSVDEVAAIQLGQLLKPKNVSQKAFLEPALYAAGAPEPGPITLSFSTDLGYEPGDVTKSYFASYFPATAPGSKLVDFDGFCLPTGQPTNSMNLYLSTRAVQTRPFLRLALLEQAVHAWRWKKILDEADVPPRADPAAQTLMRLTGPMWEWWVLRTVQRAAVDFQLCDNLDTALLAGRVVAAANVAASATRSRNAIDENRFAPGPGVYVGSDPADLEMNKLLWECLSNHYRGAAGSATAAVAATRFVEPNEAALRLLAMKLTKVLTVGYTRGERKLGLQAALDHALDQGPSNRTMSRGDPNLEPDLAWLGRATTRGKTNDRAKDNVLTHPLGVLGGDCRVGLLLADSAMPRSLTFSYGGTASTTLPHVPDLAAASHVFLTTDTWNSLRQQLDAGEAACRSMGAASSRPYGFLESLRASDCTSYSALLTCDLADLDADNDLADSIKLPQTSGGSLGGVNWQSELAKWAQGGSSSAAASAATTEGDTYAFYYHALTRRIRAHSNAVDTLFSGTSGGGASSRCGVHAALAPTYASALPMFTFNWNATGSPVEPVGELDPSPLAKDNQLYNAKRHIYQALVEAAELRFRWAEFQYLRRQTKGRQLAQASRAVPDEGKIKVAFYQEFQKDHSWEKLLERAWERLLLAEPFLLPSDASKRTELVRLSVDVFKREISRIQRKLDLKARPGSGQDDGELATPIQPVAPQRPANPVANLSNVQSPAGVPSNLPPRPDTSQAGVQRNLPPAPKIPPDKLVKPPIKLDDL
ncbi:MAG: hypothetical protein HY816_00515 [Candidatus Wallbacteria bacterium]|nr:hypothetical protein [Candidatus Wallbacteria bacterium]